MKQDEKSVDIKSTAQIQRICGHCNIREIFSSATTFLNLFFSLKVDEKRLYT